MQGSKKFVALLAFPALVAAACGKPSSTAAGGSAEDFYSDKTITIVVPQKPGGLPDHNSRLLAQYLPQYIPGNPDVIVRNMDGAQGIVAANEVYNTMPKDGTVISILSGTDVLQQAFDSDAVQMDWSKVQWIRSATESPVACYARTDAGIKDVQEIIDGGKSLIIGTSGPGSIINDGPKVINSVVGTHFDMVSGYKGIADISKAVQAGEVDGICGGMDAISNSLRDMLSGPNPTAKVLLTFGPPPRDEEAVGDAPSAESLATDEGKKLLEVLSTPQYLSNSFWVAPDVPKDQVEVLQRAAEKVFSDEKYIAQAKKEGITEVLNISASEISGNVDKLLGTPRKYLDELKKIIGT